MGIHLWWAGCTLAQPSHHLPLHGLVHRPPHRHSERPESGVHGTFRTPPLASEPQVVTFAWGGDLAGQNVCRDVTEGFSTVQAVTALALDFFIGLGDIIYADNICTATGRYGNAPITQESVITRILRHLKLASVPGRAGDPVGTLGPPQNRACGRVGRQRGALRPFSNGPSPNCS